MLIIVALCYSPLSPRTAAVEAEKKKKQKVGGVIGKFERSQTLMCTSVDDASYHVPP